MRARTSTITHKASGLHLRTPLLVPAFSSKVFGLPEGKSEIGKILRITAEWLTGVYLISAYDIHWGHIPSPRDLPVKPEFLILDSGGYEISHDNDMSAVSTATSNAQEWSCDMLSQEIRRWPKEMPAIFVSYDHPKERCSVADQIAAAKRLFKGHMDQLTCFLLKPERPAQHTIRESLRALAAHADELRSFDVIGVTEKELGGSQLARMVQIAKLRHMLDNAGVKAPIHVFGALDPISACLYFVSGAEIFDGLAWVRYAFSQDRCVYVHNHADLEFGVDFGDDRKVRSRVWVNNIYYLSDLERRMKDFQFTGRFSKLPHGDVLLKPACDMLERKMAKGGD